MVSDMNDLFTAVIVLMWSMVAIFLVIYVITAIGYWKILTKGGKPGWAALIPIYNQYQLCDMVGVSPWWILIVVLGPWILRFIPIIGSFASSLLIIYFSILLNVSLARSFNKSDEFTIGLILLGPIFYLILGFGNSTYVGKKPMNDLIFDNLAKKDK